MPAKAAHLKLARHNQDLLDHLVSTQLEEFPDWIATVAFYKAVHLVEALFDHDSGLHSHSHRDREQRIDNMRRYEDIAEYYYPLETASILARYLSDPSSDTPQEFTDIYTHEEVEDRLLSHHLHQLENSVRQFLDRPPPRRR